MQIRSTQLSTITPERRRGFSFLGINIIYFSLSNFVVKNNLAFSRNYKVPKISSKSLPKEIRVIRKKMRFGRD